MNITEIRSRMLKGQQQNRRPSTYVKQPKNLTYNQKKSDYDNIAIK